MKHHKKQYSFEEILAKLMRYCSYQERSLLEVNQKAKLLGEKRHDFDKLIALLQKDNFLNEARFTEIYIQGKLSQKRWGKYKIINGLKTKGVDEILINQYLNKIPETAFLNNLSTLMDKREISIPITKTEVARHYRYFLNKGYESHQIKKLFKENNWF